MVRYRTALAPGCPYGGLQRLLERVRQGGGVTMPAQPGDGFGTGVGQSEARGPARSWPAESAAYGSCGATTADRPCSVTGTDRARRRRRVLIAYTYSYKFGNRAGKLRNSDSRPARRNGRKSCGMSGPVQASHRRTGCAGMRQFTGPAERSEAVRGGLRPPCSGSTGPEDAMPKPGSTCRRQVSCPVSP